MAFKISVLAIVALLFLYEIFRSYLGMRSKNNPIPENVSDVYDAATYKKWQAYHVEKYRLKIVTACVSFVIDVVLLAANIYAAFASVFPDTPFWQLFSVLLLSTLSGLLLLPFDYYDTMKIEGKYGFNRSSVKTFVADKIKEVLLSFGLIIGLGAMLMGMHRAFGDWLIVVFGGALCLVVLIFSFLIPYFTRIFNKFTPLPDGELKDKLTALLEKHGYHVRAVQVMDASRRSTKSNAYFAGFGKTKTIVLYDTLINAMTPDEICAVFAHEMGHGLHRDTLKMQLLTYLKMLLIALLAFFTLRTVDLYPAFGFTGLNYGFAVLLIMSVEFALISPLIDLISNYFSRRAEFAADAQAVQEGYGKELISALKTLGKENFADLSPDRLYVKLTYSHPPLSERIEAMERLIKENGKDKEDKNEE